MKGKAAVVNDKTTAAFCFFPLCLPQQSDKINRNNFDTKM